MRIIAALSAIALGTACADADEGEDGVPLTEEPAGAPVGQPGAALPADDGDIRNVSATLTEWSIALSQDSVPAGAIAFDVSNTGTMAHRFEVEGNGEEWETEDLPPGGSVTMSLSLEPGEYEVYCPIAEGGQNHAERGMRTRLRVY